VRLADATIVGHGVAVPDGRLTNHDLEARVDTSDAWIVERTGIRERRIAGPDESTATLAVTAATAAIKSAGLIPTEIDLMIIATASPEQPLPHTGAFVGDRLGLQCGSFDLAAACAGFVYELIVGVSMLKTGCRNVLLVGAEVIVPGEGDEGLLAWDLGCDGSAARLLEIPAGGSRMPATIETVQDRKHYMTMAGQEVFRRAVRVVVDSATTTLERAGMTTADIDWFVPHQANLRIIEAAGNRLGIPPERTVVNIERYGNTSSASIPLALFEAVDDGRVKAGDLVLLSGFGAGMTWASAVIRWGTLEAQTVG